jgi:tetratricopeptide (TPR) repeat protein
MLAEAVATNRAGRHADAAKLFDQVLDETDDSGMQASALIGKAQFSSPKDHWELFEQAAELSRFDSLGFWDESYATGSFGAAARGIGRYDAAAKLLERSLELARSWRYPVWECHAAFLLSSVHAATGRLDESAAVLDEAIHRTRRLVGPNVTTAGVRLRAAHTARLRGELDEAQRHVDEAYRAADRDDMLPWRRWAAENEALVARDRGNLGRARDLLEGAGLRRAEQDQSELPLIRAAQAGVELRDGEPGRALQLLPEVLARPEWLSHLQAVEALDLTSIALSQSGQAEVAARVFGAAEAERERTGLVVQAPDRPLLDEAREQTRVVLADGWDSIYAKGRAMSLEEAVALAAELAAHYSEGP